MPSISGRRGRDCWPDVLPKCLLLGMALCVASPSSYAQDRDFTVVGGNDRPVCRAYLSALQTLSAKDSEFRFAPWCDGNLNPSTREFPDLRRVPVTDMDEIFLLRYRVEDFLQSQNQFYSEKRFTTKDREEARRATELAVKAGQLKMWRYEPPLDIDNDGKPDSLLWYRYGRCDSLRPVDSVVLIVDAKTLLIDEKETQRLFGDPRPYPAPVEGFIRLRDGKIGVFRYRDLNYVYAWGNDKAWTKANKLRTTAKVYLWQADRVSTVCELLWNKERTQ